MAKLKRRFPAFVSGFDETEHEVENQADLLKVDWVEGLVRTDNFHRLSQSDISGNIALMVEFDHGKVFYVVGWLTENLGLPEWKHYE
jgi:hypothetical protein